MNSKLMAGKIGSDALIPLLFLLSVIPSMAQNGNGTPGNPYQITTCEQLQLMNQHLNSYWILMNPIDCYQTQTGGGPWSAKGFNSIGDSAAPFKGDFDGECLPIKNLYINNPAQNYTGLFGYTDDTAYYNIKDVNLVDAIIIGNNYTGGIMGYKLSYNFTNGFVNGLISGGEFTGGAIGRSDNYQGTPAAMDHTFTKAVVSGKSFTGGVTGQITTYQGGGAEMFCCSAAGDVKGTDKVGGVVGNCATYEGGAAYIDSSYSTGNVTGTDTVGGLAGWVGPYMGGGSQIYRSFATGNVSGRICVGGLVGNNGPYSGGAGLISETYSQGNVTGKEYVGGLIGYEIPAGVDWGVDTSYSAGIISGAKYSGGLVGYENGTSQFDTCFWNVTLNPADSSIGNLGSYPSIYPSTTAQMQTQATYLGWNFNKVWTIAPSRYPTFTGSLISYSKCNFLTTLQAAFNYSPFPVCTTDSVIFSDESNGSPTSWSWNFDDTVSGHNTSIVENPTHLFSSAGTYFVILIVNDGKENDTVITPVIVTNCILGTENKSFNGDVEVYPNPNKGKFTILFSAVNLPYGSQGPQSSEKPTIIEIYTILGVKVFSQSNYQITKSSNYILSIDLSNQPTGVYFYRVIAGNIIFRNGKVVIE